MANEYEISAGIVPIDNSSGATQNNYYISAGLPPTDTAVGGLSIPVAMQNMRGGFNPIGMRGGFINAD